MHICALPAVDVDGLLVPGAARVVEEPCGARAVVMHLSTYFMTWVITASTRVSVVASSLVPVDVPNLFLCVFVGIAMEQYDVRIKTKDRVTVWSEVLLRQVAVADGVLAESDCACAQPFNPVLTTLAC